MSVKEVKRCNCGTVAKYRIWTGYPGWAYYCEKCKDLETMR